MIKIVYFILSSKGPDGKYCAEEKNILCRIHPETGLAIIFNHNRLHEGEKLGYVILCFYFICMLCHVI